MEDLLGVLTEKLLQVDLGITRPQDLGSRIEGLDEVFDTADLFLVYQVGLVEENDVGEFDLVGQAIDQTLQNQRNDSVIGNVNPGLQIGDIPLVLGSDLGAMPIRQEIRRIEIPQKGRTIHHTDTSIKSGDLAQPALSDETRQAFTRLGSRGRVGRVDRDGGFDGGQFVLAVDGFGEFLGKCLCYLFDERRGDYKRLLLL